MAKIAKPTAKSYPHLNIMEDISKLISHSRDLQETLNSIVATVAERMETEVCSLYTLDPDKERFTLRATKGLDPECVGKVFMARDRGVTGLSMLVIERMMPVMVVDAVTNPRYDYFPEAHEELFHSYLGVPLIEQRLPVGVLVVQTSRRRKFSRDEIRMLTTISAQISRIIVQAWLVGLLKSEGREREAFQNKALTPLRRVAKALGLPLDILIKNPMPQTYRSVFLSYGGPDEAIARRFYEELTCHGISCFFFPVSAIPGVRLHRTMSRGVDEYDRVVLLCSQNSLHRSGLLNELEQVLDREAREGGSELLIPIALDDAVFAEWAPGRRDLASQVRSRVVADFRRAIESPTEWTNQMGRLLQSLTITQV